MRLPLGPTMTLAALIQATVSLLAGLEPQPAASGLPGARVDPGRRVASTPGHGFRSPLTSPLVVLDLFRPPAEDWMTGHRGVDLATSVGDGVVASGPGLVLWAGELAGRGVVSVLHADGRRTTYEPLTPVVDAGDHVDAGDLIGRVAPGASHCGGVPQCLHWGLRRGEVYLDPLSLLPPRGRPRLLPLAERPP